MSTPKRHQPETDAEGRPYWLTQGGTILRVFQPVCEVEDCGRPALPPPAADDGFAAFLEALEDEAS
jgi:hypothetical protein